MSYLIDKISQKEKPTIGPRGENEGPTKFSERVKTAWKKSKIQNSTAIWQEYISRINEDNELEEEIAKEYVNFLKGK